MLQRQEWLKTIDWNLIVLDEAHAIKTPGTRQAKEVKALSGRARIALTGTPVRRKKLETAAKPLPPDPFPDPLTGDAIRAWRSDLGETLAKFAARFKVSAAAVSSWEKKGQGEVFMFPATLALLKKGWGKKRRR